VDRAWELGVRYFDTAPFYGFGLSERRLGDALRGYARDSFLISTKVGVLLSPADPDPGNERHGFRSPMPFEPVYDYSYDGVMRSVEASLHRLGLARIDILYMHDLGRATHGDAHPHHFARAIEGGFRAMTELHDQEVVAAIGLGVNETEICAESLAHADFDLFLIAGRYTLLDRSAAPFLDLCGARGIGVVAAGVFNSGVLATGSAANPAYYDYAPASPEILERVERLERIGARHGVPLVAAALQFAAGHPAVTLPLIGTADPELVEAASSLSKWPIPIEYWQDLDEVEPKQIV
jgi:D-threo-aldose 1-dehydrogenase